jgi:hypothetical protein
MPGVVPKFVGGPITYKVKATVHGGRLVEAAAADADGGVVQEAGAGSVLVLGVATKDARKAVSPTSTDTFGNPITDVTQVTDEVAVGKGGVYPVTYAANASFGQKLIAAANGTVTPAGATPDARTVIGECREPLNVVIATNPVGLAYIY